MKNHKNVLALKRFGIHLKGVLHFIRVFLRITNATNRGRVMRSAKFTILIALLIVSCGCAALVAAVAGAGVGVASYAYLTGDLKIEYPRPYESVWDASLNALKDLDIKVKEKRKDSISGKIKAERASGTPVTIKVKNKGSKLTIVKIRVGTFGDKEASITIMEAIDSYLGVK